MDVSLFPLPSTENLRAQLPRLKSLSARALRAGGAGGGSADNVYLGRLLARRELRDVAEVLFRNSVLRV